MQSSTRQFWPWRRGRIFWGSAVLSGLIGGAALAGDPVLPTPPNLELPILVQPPAQNIHAVSLFDDEKKVEPKKEEARKEEPRKTEPVLKDGEEKRYSFEFADMPWSKVFDWYSEITNLPMVGGIKAPTSTFTFKPTKENGVAKKYTIAEITDFLNDQLAEKGYVLMRREKSFGLRDASEKHTETARRVDEKALFEMGSREVVQILFKPEKLLVGDLVSELKKLVGPFGDVVAIESANHLILTDQADNLRLIIKMIKEIEKDDSSIGQYTHQCVYIPVRDAERILKEQLGDPKAMISSVVQNAQQQQRGGRFGPGGPGFGMDFGQPQAPTINLPKMRVQTITADETTGKLFISGSADKIAEAKKILNDIDKPTDGSPRVAYGPPTLQNYDVTTGTAETVKTILKERFKGSNTIQIESVGTSSLIVFAHPADHLAIARLIAGNKNVKPKMVRKIQLSSAEAEKVTKTLAGMYGDSKMGGPFIDFDAGANTLIVQATADQIAEVELAVKTIEGTSTNGSTATMRILTIPDGNAGNLAEAIERIMKPLVKNPIKTVVPTFGDGKPEPKLEQKKYDPRKDSSLPSLDLDPATSKPRKSEGIVAIARPREMPDVKFADPAKMLTGAQADPKEQKKELAPITITALGGRLIIQSEDPDALQMVTEVVRLLTKDGGDGDFTVIRLRNANATDAAKILDLWFNGPPVQNQGGGGLNLGIRLPFPFGGGGQDQGATTATKPKVRIVADPYSNSLLVRASPLNVLTIRSMLEQAIDFVDDDNNAVTKTFIIGPLKNSSATDIAQVIRDVFRENTGSTGQTQQVGGFPGVGFPFGGQQQQQQPTATRQPARLAIGVDDRTNSIVLACPQSLYTSVEKLIKELDDSAKDAAKTIKIVSVKGVDPDLIQTTIDAIQGRRTNRGTTGGFGTGGFGNTGGGFGPGQGGGGFGNPGGGFGGPGQGGGGFGNPGGGFGGNRGGGGFGNPGQGGGGFGNGGGGMRGPGGGNFGGGGMRGPGGGGGARGGGGTGPDSETGRGPDFFEQRDTDVPFGPYLYDPRADLKAGNVILMPRMSGPRVNSLGALRLASFEEAQQPKKGGPVDPKTPPPMKDLPTGGKDDEIRAPRSPVTVTGISDLGIIVINANNQSDLEETEKIINVILARSKEAQIVLETVELKYGDATSVAAQLNQILSRVNVGAAANVILPPQQQGQQRVAQQQPLVLQVGGAGQQTQNIPAAVATNTLIIPLPRFNSILIGAAQSRMVDIKKLATDLDKPISTQSQATPFPLKRASAQNVATQVQNFYANRFPGETTAQNQIRVTFDTSTNTVFVQAAPADLDEIRNLIERIDNFVSSAINELRIIRLQNTAADELANTILTALTSGILQQSTGTTGQQGANPFAQFGQQQFGQQFGQQNQNRTGTGSNGFTTKTTSLRFLNARGGIIESGYLEDTHITADVRSNSLVVSAPEKTIRLVEEVVRALDVPSAARSFVKVYTLKRADAVNTLSLIQSIYSGTSTATAGQAGQFGQGGQTTSQLRPLLTLTEDPSPGATLVGLTATADTRTNSIIVSGPANDQFTIESIIARLEDTAQANRINQVYKLKNASAVDVQTALSSYVSNVLTQLSSSGLGTAYQYSQKNIFVVAEPVTNTLLINATPEGFAQVLPYIERLDAQPYQVVVQVLIAQVTLNNSEEFGVEFGLQNPILFQRGVTSTTGATYAQATGSPLPPGVTTTSTQNIVALPGTNFTNPLSSINNITNIGSGIVGLQGLGSLGVGRVSPNSSIGGFVFSAASDTFNLLVRALKTQGRIDVLSRPQIQTLDNQTGFITVGQDFPYINGAIANNVNNVTPVVAYRSIGVSLRVTPRINPEGKVLMRVEPTVSSATAQQVNLGNNLLATVFNQQAIETTVLAGDGETVVIGGLITKNDSKTENKIPWLGDLPLIGAAFRFRTQVQSKSELIVILTPHIVRTSDDIERVKCEEFKRMDWITRDVVKIHGDPTAPPRVPLTQTELMPYFGQSGLPAVVPGVDGGIPTLPGPVPVGPGGPILPGGPGGPAPMPVVPGSTSQKPPELTPFEPKAEVKSVVQASATSAKQGSTGTGGDQPADAPEKKESRGWNPFRRK